MPSPNRAAAAAIVSTAALIPRPRVAKASISTTDRDDPADTGKCPGPRRIGCDGCGVDRRETYGMRLRTVRVVAHHPDAMHCGLAWFPSWAWASTPCYRRADPKSRDEAATLASEGDPGVDDTT